VSVSASVSVSVSPSVSIGVSAGWPLAPGWGYADTPWVGILKKQLANHGHPQGEYSEALACFRVTDTHGVATIRGLLAHVRGRFFRLITMLVQNIRCVSLCFDVQAHPAFLLPPIHDNENFLLTIHRPRFAHRSFVVAVEDSQTLAGISGHPLAFARVVYVFGAFFRSRFSAGAFIVTVYGGARD